VSIVAKYWSNIGQSSEITSKTNAAKYLSHTPGEFMLLPLLDKTI